MAQKKETFRELEIKAEMGALLKKIRLDNGIKKIGLVTKELGLSRSALPKIENGVNFPTESTLNRLMGVYRVKPEDYKKAIALREEILSIRKARKKQ